MKSNPGRMSFRAHVTENSFETITSGPSYSATRDYIIAKKVTELPETALKFRVYEIIIF